LRGEYRTDDIMLIVQKDAKMPAMAAGNDFPEPLMPEEDSNQVRSAFVDSFQA
jgi:hypothetical protein